MGGFHVRAKYSPAAVVGQRGFTALCVAAWAVLRLGDPSDKGICSGMTYYTDPSQPI
jgi:hypothetical protein